MHQVVTLTPNSSLDLWTTTDHMESGQKMRCAAPTLDPGGGGINVSRVIHRLGGNTVALFTAGGFFGEQIASMLAKEGVLSNRIDIAGQSRLSVHFAVAQTGKVYRLVMPGPELTASEGKELLDRFEKIAKNSTMSVASGSLPPGAGEEYWAVVARQAKKVGCPLLLDSSEGVKPALEVGLFLLRQDEHEITRLTGKPLSWPNEIAEWADAQIARGTCKMIIVTHAADGALLVSRDERIRVIPPKVEVNSAVGAGDSFMGALCLGLANGNPSKDALRLAVSAAAAALLTPGTELCRKDDVERLLRKCSEAQPV